MALTHPDHDHSAWNPGLTSELPRELLPLATVFRPENSDTSAATALELSDFCGLPPQDLVAFNVERLVVHELLIRVIADLTVSDGERYEDLGLNFRRMTSTIHDTYLRKSVAEIARTFDDLKVEARQKLVEALSDLDDPPQAPPPAAPPSWLDRLVGRGRPPEPPAPQMTREERELRAMTTWRGLAGTAGGALDRACYQALSEIVSAIISRRGSLIGDRTLIADLALTRVCNRYGSDLVGEAIDPIVREAARREGFPIIPRQDHPIVMNVKGASAAGKSTLRPLQKELVRTLDLDWDDFALISPDIWRKYLLDYGELGDAYKYAGTLTGYEIAIIDEKLDRYMARKAAQSQLTHMLIDRFRFDSFRPEVERTEATHLLTRFGELIFLFFMVTPPEATVERAWRRGEQVGRYKAVDDLLDHNVEAFTGMPGLFLNWALNRTKRVHFEFLDNSVAKGDRPRTIAFGWNAEMVVLDVKAMLDIDRFRKINIWATSPDEVYANVDLAPAANTEFLKRCATHLKRLIFCDQATGRAYATMEDGVAVWTDPEGLAEARRDPDTRAGLDAIGVTETPGPAGATGQPRLALEEFGRETIGAWGEAGA